MTQRETLEWLWFSLVMGIGAEIEPVLSALGSPHELYQYRETNDFSAILTAAQCSRLKAVQLEDAADLLIRCAEQGVRILPFPHAEYPQKLREIPDAPPVLYAVGDTALLNEGCAVAIVGSRRPSAYGRQAAAEIAKGLCDANVTIVSGMADGLDSVAHQTALHRFAAKRKDHCSNGHRARTVLSASQCTHARRNRKDGAGHQRDTAQRKGVQDILFAAQSNHRSLVGRCMHRGGTKAFWNDAHGKICQTVWQNSVCSTGKYFQSFKRRHE